MESLLRRAKSTRGLSERPLEFEPPYFPPELPPLSATRPQQQQNSGSARTILRSASIRKLSRRKSISSTRESMVSLGMHESWQPPRKMMAGTAEERKHRASIFFGLVSPSLQGLPTQQPSKRAPPPPPIRLSPYPTRPSTAGATVGNENSGFGGGIGLALGSPSGISALNNAGTCAVVFPSLERAPSTPEFQLPSTPFGIGPDPVQSTAVEEPKATGWKIKLFGRAMFSRKTTAKSREPSPDAIKLADSKPHTLTKKKPRILKKSGSAPAPCLDVDIPSVEMERYSVMFGTLLNPSEQSCLYARRRSREVSKGLPKEDELHDHVPGQPALQVPQRPALRRHATTGIISPRSPLSNLGDNLRRLSSESRRSGSHSPSRQSPLPSPYNRSPLPSPGIFRSQTTAADGRPPASPRHPPVRNEMLFPPPLTHSSPPSTHEPEHTTDNQSRPEFRFSRISEESSIDTPRGSFESGDDEWMTRAEDDDLEPAWEMLSPPSRKSRQSGFLGEDPSPITPEYDAEVSIARTVSISKRELMLPVVAKHKMPVSRKTVHEPMRPRIVEHRMSTSVSNVQKMPERAEVVVQNS